MKFLKKLAEVFSIVLHPLLLCTWLFWGLFVFAPSVLSPVNFSLQYRFILLIFITTFAIPALSLGVLKVTGNIQSLSLRDRKERKIPFIFISLFYIVTTLLFYKKIPDIPIFYLLTGSVTGLILLLTLITLFWKVSIHATSWAALLGICYGIALQRPYAMLLWPLIVLTLILGGISSARLLLKAHTPRQVWVGWLIGFIYGFTSIYLIL